MQHDCLSRLLGDGGKWIETVWGEENILYRAKPEQPKQNKDLLHLKRSLLNQPRNVPFQMYSLSPYLPQFQQSAGATLL